MNWHTMMWQSDGVSVAVSLLLLLMSVSSWFIIVYKSWLLHRSIQQLLACKALFWQAGDWAQARSHWLAVDTQAMFMPLLDAITHPAQGLSSQVAASDQLTRRLREGLQAVRARLQFGQDLLATIGATAPFVGLLGTVWGIFHALTNLAVAGQYTIDKVAQPVGEALVMTAAGLAVAIPAVMAYNLMGRRLARLDTELEGLAYDLRALAQAKSLPTP
ncbi:MAG: MotA/TolQ/ExbB proton channel family protein [Betaproteobacteria bacterium]|jgi:biopolymer transport protein ExbB|nr:MotA/TolQ/ExbB proton channel family protein [Betaproteobacteria bacterium]